MAGNSFIKLRSSKGKIAGESLQEGHKDEIEISNFTWKISAETSFTKGGGASVGKATPGTCEWGHYFDTASPMIMLNCVIGTHFDEAIATMCKTTGASKPEVYFTMTMKDCFITEATIDASEDGTVNQKVSMVFKEVLIAYKKQENNGKLSNTEKSFKWNIPKGEGEVG